MSCRHVSARIEPEGGEVALACKEKLAHLKNTTISGTGEFDTIVSESAGALEEFTYV